MVETLENGLRNYARVLHALTGRDMSQIPGGGAAGGMGIAAIVFLEAEMKPGIEIVMQAVKLEEAVKEASLVITGEGRIDSQTAGGKAPIGVASVAKRHHVPVIGIAGVLGDGVEVVIATVLMPYSVFCRGWRLCRKFWRTVNKISTTAPVILPASSNLARTSGLVKHKKSHGSHRGKIQHS